MCKLFTPQSIQACVILTVGDARFFAAKFQPCFATHAPCARLWYILFFRVLDGWQGQDCQILGHSNVDARGRGEPLREGLLHGHQGCYDGRGHRRPEGEIVFRCLFGLGFFHKEYHISFNELPLEAAVNRRF